MSFSRKVKEELLKKSFTAIEKTFKIETVETERDRKRLREFFLKRASITDPEKDHHLEFVCRGKEEASEVSGLLSRFSLRPRAAERGGYCIIYLKDASEISDVLNIIGAHEALMDFENVRIRKELSENVNRRVNFEAANISRTVRASIRQTEDIRLIEERIGLERLGEGLREIARARLRRPDASLEELAETVEPPIGKSGANHRMRKLSRIASDLRREGCPSTGIREIRKNQAL